MFVAHMSVDYDVMYSTAETSTCTLRSQHTGINWIINFAPNSSLLEKAIDVIKSMAPSHHCGKSDNSGSISYLACMASKRTACVNEFHGHAVSMPVDVLCTSLIVDVRRESVRQRGGTLPRNPIEHLYQPPSSAPFMCSSVKRCLLTDPGR
jgi:hypothetical protein